VNRRENLITSLLLFVAVFLLHGLSPNATSADSHWIVPQMLSMLRSGDTDLNEYPQQLRAAEYHGLDCVDANHRLAPPGSPGSRYYVWYPIGPAVVALPVFEGLDLILRVIGPPLAKIPLLVAHPITAAFFRRDFLASYALVEMEIASFLVALTTVFVFLIARVSLSRRASLLLALLFAFGTSAWSTGSRALWQHGPNMLVLAAALYLLVRAESRPSLLVWSAAPLMFAYFTRPTSSIVFAAVAAYVLVHHRRVFPKWAALALAVAAPFILYYLSIYHRSLPPYYTQQGLLPLSLDRLPRFLTALAGHLISPSRGLFVFSPFLLFALAGMALALRKGWRTPLSYYLIAAVVLHWTLISLFADWTAGYSYGPRYFSDLLPIFMFFLIPVFQAFEAGWRPRWAVAAFTVCALAAVFAHGQGALNWPAQAWNGGDLSKRVWDWSDPQFLRGLRR